MSDQGYHLTVARFEPENHVLEIVRGFRPAVGELPLVVVGAPPVTPHDYAEPSARPPPVTSASG